jgi:uncharacterized LabA/DUF88 family protein
MEVVFIDGENTKGRIREVYAKFSSPIPEWHEYDFAGLFTEVLTMTSGSRRRFYRATPKRHPDIPDIGERLLNSYRSLGGHLHRQGFESISAGVLRADYKSTTDKKPTYREKGVDVSLAVDMISMAYENVFDTAYLVASDSDYQPAVTALKKLKKKIVYVGFEVNPNLGLIAKTTDRIIIPNKTVLAFGNNLFTPT